VLETLTSAERLAFVLHDMFAVPFEEIAPIVGRSPEATRQLASRARRRVRGAAPVPDPDLTAQWEVVEAFLAAARAARLHGRQPARSRLRRVYLGASLIESSGPMAYAKRNLRDVDDSAVRFGLSETQEARFPRSDLGAEQTGINFLTVKPSRREAFAHRHRTAEEIYVVLAGSGRVKLDDDLVELLPLDVVRVSPGVARCFEAGPDGLEVLIFGPHVEGDSEMVAGFWGRPE
jgi:mannose-6-phosphate isomerase-like protein (cupin superfamily)